MSFWRKEASAKLPELQSIIASREVNNPMMLWIELRSKFDQLCEQDPPPLDLLARIWRCATWCMEQGHADSATAAAVAFCEHLLDRKAKRHILSEIMTRKDYEGLRTLLLYHHSEDGCDQPFRAIPSIAF
jgi:hypothetical protein